MTIAPDVEYETRIVKTVRGMETRTRAKIENEGWEFVSQTQGTVRSELRFRRQKPKTPWKLIGIGGGVVGLLIIVLLIISAIGGGGGRQDASAVASSPSPSRIAPSEASAPPPTPQPTPDAPAAPDTTVDELLAMLNSAEMGGIKVGDRFRLNGELFMSDLWMTGASGDFSVMLKAQGGAQDLTVFVEESDAAQWQDGTRVEMVVEMVEVTIDGETTDGWLRAKSSTTTS